MFGIKYLSLTCFLLAAVIIVNVVKAEPETEEEEPKNEMTKKEAKKEMTEEEQNLITANMKADWYDQEKHKPRLGKADKAALAGLAYHGGSRPKRQALPPCNRKEIRTLSAAERKELFEAIQLCHNTTAPNTTKTYYEILVGLHISATAPSAHFNPAFICWHREYLLRFETCLRKFRPNACLPYINWSLDRQLRDVFGLSSCDSVLFSRDFMGTANGIVSNGVAGGWRVTSDCYGSGTGALYRACNSANYYYLPTSTTINQYTAYNAFAQFCQPDNVAFENAHGNCHAYVGGQMNMLSCSPHDIIFWLHHAFVDCMFETWRGTHATTASHYPDYMNTPHKSYNISMPFDTPSPPTLNSDCLTTKYNGLYTCTATPTACTNDGNCGPGMWCYNSKCYTKIRPGSACGSFPSNICFQESTCTTTVSCRKRKCTC